MASKFIKHEKGSQYYVITCANCGEEFEIPRKKVGKKTGKIEKFISEKNFFCCESCKQNFKKK